MNNSPQERSIIGRNWGAAGAAVGTFAALELFTEAGNLWSLGAAVAAFVGFKVAKTVLTEAFVEGDYEDRKA